MITKLEIRGDKMSEKVNVKKGLEGVVVDETKIAKVIPEINSFGV